MTRIDKHRENIREHLPLANSPMVFDEEEKAMVGINANGSCKDIRQFKRSFMPDKFSILS